MTQPISRFPVPRLEELPDDIRARISAVQEKAGFIPNVFLVLAHRPDEFRAFFAYHDALMLKEGGLSKGEREMIVVATSAANECHYCVIAHGALVRIYEKQPLLADQVATNYRKADVTPRQRAMLDFAMKVALRSAEIGEADFAALREHGFSDEDGWDIAASAACAEIASPVSSISSALRDPTARLSATIGVEQKRPIFTPGVAKRASCAATARSHEATSWQPAAVAVACTCAITGCGMPCSVSISRVQASNRSR